MAEKLVKITQNQVQIVSHILINPSKLILGYENPYIFSNPYMLQCIYKNNQNLDMTKKNYGSRNINLKGASR